jgi:TetR/AcrR family transcriptional repressor of bet genes
MPKRVDHGERRALIASAAADAIDQQGLDRVRLVDVARRASCTTGAVSHYFPGKDAVLSAALEHVLRNLAGHSAVAAASPHTTQGADWAIEVLAEVLPIDETRQRDWRVWLAFCGRAVHVPELAELHRTSYAEIQRAFADELVAGGIAKDGADARNLAVAMVAALDGLGLRAVLEPAEWPRERLRSMLSFQLGPLLRDPDRANVPTLEPIAEEKSA